MRQFRMLSTELLQRSRIDPAFQITKGQGAAETSQVRIRERASLSTFLVPYFPGAFQSQNGDYEMLDMWQNVVVIEVVSDGWRITSAGQNGSLGDADDMLLVVPLRLSNMTGYVIETDGMRRSAFIVEEGPVNPNK